MNERFIFGGGTNDETLFVGVNGAMETQFIVAISVSSGILCLFFVLSVVFKSVRKKLERYIQERFDKNEIIGATTRANFFGEKSKGGKQIRGNGALVLTKDQLVFIRAMPFKEYIVPIKSIKRVSMPNSFNGKSVFSKLLCVHYVVEGVEDSIAWVIKNPEKWQESIEALLLPDR